MEKEEKSLFQQANEALSAENYPKAVELYSMMENLDVDSLVSRAHAYIKMEEYAKAKIDADLAIDISRKTGSCDSKAYLRSGVSSFHMGNYREAKNSFQEGLKIDKDPGLRQWVTWCDEKIAKFNNDKKSPEKTRKVEEEKEKEEVIPSQTVVPPPSKIKHDWYQTETTVVIEIRIKNVKQEDVHVEFTETSLSVTVKLSSGNDYNLELDLCHPILPESSVYKIMSTKIEIKLKKAEGSRWSSLEGDGKGILGNDALRYPTSSGKNWDKIECDISKELAEDKPEGEAALNELFEKIYKDGDDEVRKAMNKSFQESGGTVLSTNWNDIKKEKVEVKPPDGMEFKKW